MRTLVAALIGLAILLPAAAAAKAPPFVGVWKGTAKTAAATPMPVVITVTAKYRSNNSGTITYPAQRCSGKLAFLKQSGRVLTLRESIIKGTCAKGGSIQLTQVMYSQLWVAWYAPGVADPAWSGYVTLGGR